MRRVINLLLFIFRTKFPIRRPNYRKKSSIKNKNKVDLLALYFLYVRLVIPCYGRCIEMGIPLYCFWFQQGSAYAGCQRLFMRGFWFRSSLKTCRPAADNRRKLLVAREKKTSGTLGRFCPSSTYIYLPTFAKAKSHACDCFLPKFPKKL